MQAVFLDRATFSDEVNLHRPTGLSDYITYQTTEQDDALIVERCQNADIIITNKVQLSAHILQQLPKLKMIQLTATGMNNIDVEACEQLGVKLCNVAGYAIKSVPEHTFMLMLSAMRACNHYHKAVASDAWQQTGKFCLIDEPLYDLEGKTLGIIGAGTIGRRVAQIARVFGMNVLFAEHKGKAPRSSDYTDFNTVLATADVLSLHCPLTTETQHLINRDTIQLMKPKPLVVNVARGGVVDSQAMADALNNKLVLGYASDVFEVEPIQDDDPLRKFVNHPRVIYSPHNAWGSLAGQQTLWDQTCAQINQFVRAC